MRFRIPLKLWSVFLPLVVVAMVSARDFVQAQQEELCYLETTPGQRIPLSKICGKSEERKMNDEMWDENNYDPNFVQRDNSNGIWIVREGGQRPFKNPDGGIIWPDGRVTQQNGHTVKLVLKDNKVVGIQHFKLDKITPLKPGEKLRLSSGDVVEQLPF